MPIIIPTINTPTHFTTTQYSFFLHVYYFIEPSNDLTGDFVCPHQRGGALINTAVTKVSVCRN